MTHLDLFSGIGGFALAAKWAGIETVQFVEKEPSRQGDLARNFPGVPTHDDIHTFEPSGPVDLVTGGFPCQPFSVAGKRKGKQDDRYLWPQMLRVIESARPTWVVGENVPGIVKLALDRVLSDLEGLGYTCWPANIPACAVNAPHQRKRIWVVAHRDNGLRVESDGKIQAGRDAFGDSGGLVGHVERVRGLQPERSLGDFGGRPGHPSGFDDYEWLLCADGKARRVKPGVLLLAHGVPRRVDQIRGLGNAIVPQVAYEILRNIAAVHRGYYEI